MINQMLEFFNAYLQKIVPSFEYSYYGIEYYITSIASRAVVY